MGEREMSQNKSLQSKMPLAMGLAFVAFTTQFGFFAIFLFSYRITMFYVDMKFIFGNLSGYKYWRDFILSLTVL